MSIGFCILNPKNCTLLHSATIRTEDKCGRCGFNLEEYNRRIEDIRENGLTQLNRYTRGYIVKKPKERSDKSNGTP